MAFEFHRVIHLDPEMSRVDLDRGSVTPMGETSALVEYGGVRLIVNPTLAGDVVQSVAWREISGDIGIGAVGEMSPVRLPPIDAVVQLDPPDQQFDAFVAQYLHPGIPVVTFPVAVAALEERAMETVHPLTTWQWIVLRKGDASITLTALPVCDIDEDDCQMSGMGCMVELRSRPDESPYRIYLSGPARVAPQVEEIAYRYPRIDLGVVSLNSTMLHGVMLAVDVLAGVELTNAIRPGQVIPVHRLDHVFDWSRRDFLRAMVRRGDCETTVLVEQGQPFWFDVTGHANRRVPLAPGLPYSAALTHSDTSSTPARSR